MDECCVEHLLTRPPGWVGTVTWCPCGELLMLRGGSWFAPYSRPSMCSRCAGTDPDCYICAMFEDRLQ